MYERNQCLKALIFQSKYFLLKADIIGPYYIENPFEIIYYISLYIYLRQVFMLKVFSLSVYKRDIWLKKNKSVNK